MLRSKRISAKATAIALAAIFGASTVTIVTADAAYAAGKKKDKKNNKGGKKSSSNKSGSNKNRSASNNRGGNSAIASELGGLNAAMAKPNALRNASPNSIQGKFYTYQQSKLAIVDAESARNRSYTELYRLQNLSSAQIAAEYPNGDYNAAVNAAVIRFNADTTIYANAINTANQSLSALTNGQQLSPKAMAELNALLGL